MNLFDKSALLEKVGKQFQYDDFAIVLQGSGNRIQFGAMAKGETHPKLNHFTLMREAPEDLLFVDCDFNLDNISGFNQTNKAVKSLLGKCTTISRNLSEYFSMGEQK